MSILSNLSFRTFGRRQILVINCISSHCLSTTIPPSNDEPLHNHKQKSQKPRKKNAQHHNGVLPHAVSSPKCEMPPPEMAARIARDMSQVKRNERDAVVDSSETLRTWYSGGYDTIAVDDVHSKDQNEKSVMQQGRRTLTFTNLSHANPDSGNDNKSNGSSGNDDDQGPEPEYNFVRAGGFQSYLSTEPFPLKYGGTLQGLRIAYETWGKLNEQRDNAVLVSSGLSAASHARSNNANTQPGWWERFIGPGCALDTDKYFVICMNNLGGCHGTTGPSSENPATGKPYGADFPTISIEDMVRAQFRLLDSLGIYKIYGSIGSSLGGMLSLTSSILFPERVKRVVSISACMSSHPTSIAMRYLQRKAIMTDPLWNQGHYYNSAFPKHGMKLAREIATLTYRSGPEWEQRFNRKRIGRRYHDESEHDMIANEKPTLNPSFLIESYLDHQGEAACTKLDPNTLLYISKAMDLYDIGESFGNIRNAMVRVKCPVMVIGVQTDLLFPVWQQREMATALQETGNKTVTYYELNSIYGHDTFLLDLNGVGSGIKGFLETNPSESGHASC